MNTSLLVGTAQVAVNMCRRDARAFLSCYAIIPSKTPIVFFSKSVRV